MRAADVMTTRVVAVEPDTPVSEAARLMLDRRVSALPVVDKMGKVIGVVSDGDLMRRPESGTERHRSWWLELVASNAERARHFEKSHGGHVRNVMTVGAVTVSEEAPISEIAEILESRGIKRVPVVREGRLVGIVSRADIMRVMITHAAASAAPSKDDRALRLAVLAELDRQKWISVSPASVLVEGGVVHLWGHALSHEELEALTVAAEGVPGVREVLNHMVVAPGASFQPI